MNADVNRNPQKIRRVKTDDLSNSGLPAILKRECDLPQEPLAQSWVRYESQGCLLIIGDGDRLIDVGESLKELLHVVVLTQEAPVQGFVPDGIDCVYGELIELSGCLGNFDVRIRGKEGLLNLALLCPGEKERFDLILDLSKTPFFPAEVPPLGYYAPRGDPVALSRAVTELSALNGVFHKPRFFSYSSGLCAHGRQGITGCSRCLEGCPTNAITDDGDKIRINPYLCQGCGTCMLVCPSGAISSNPEFDDDPLAFICSELSSCPAASEVCVLLYDAGLDQAQIEELDLVAKIIPVELHELAKLGMEAWLTALSCGADQVVLLSGEHIPQHTLAALEQQLDYTRAILAAMGYDPNRVCMIRFQDGHDLTAVHDDGTRSAAMAPVTFNRLNGKRKNIEKALKRLASLAPKPSIDDVRLSAEAPFGGLLIDKQKCTLCMGCVKPCPTSAMRRVGDLSDPKLGFVEALCVQCGICAAACPEEAIELLPRLKFDQQVRSRVQILNESPPFHCVTCGTPFTTLAIVELMSERLRDNPFFQGEGLKKLKQCPDCRARYNVIEQLERVNRIPGD